MVKIKICGLFLPEDIVYVNQYKPEYIGFVFAKSHRQITIEKARKLKALLVPDIQVVGVFVDAPIDEIALLVEEKVIDMVQLHGKEDQAYIARLKEKVQVPMIKAIAINDKEDIKNMDFDVDYYLLESSHAGSGQTFDWSYITQLDKPYFLAGGITLENIEQALQVGSYAIDVSSGVETIKKKDAYKIQEIIRRVKYGNR